MLPFKSIKKASEHEALSGIFYCPLCTQSEQVVLEFSPELLPQVLQVNISQWAKIFKVNCPDCERGMWLSKIINHHKKAIIDTYQWIDSEHCRLKSLHN